MENPSFFLEGVIHDKDELQDFEGPLSLILMLLQKNKIEIRDIKIAEILDQYLAYLNEMQQMDLEIASEFIQMASHLLYIKTKTLLTTDEKEVGELELLMSSLEQLRSKDRCEAVRRVTPELRDASERGMLYFPKRPEPLPKKAGVYEYRHEPADLLRAMLGLCARGVKAQEKDRLSPVIPSRITYSVRDKSSQVLASLKKNPRSLGEFYRGCSSRSEVVATFLSILELCSMGSIRLTRGDDDYIVSFAGGDVDEILERSDDLI